MARFVEEAFYARVENPWYVQRHLTGDVSEEPDMSSDPRPSVLGYTSVHYTLPAKRRRWPVVILGLMGTLAVGVTVILPSMCRSREGANRVKCASNMKQIGLAAIMYANDHGGQFPDDLAALLRTQDLVPAVFVCPSGKEAPASGETTQAVLAEMGRPGHVSYVYVGKGLTVNSPPDSIVLYELPTNHPDDSMSAVKTGDEPPNDGMNVLCADGHVEWLSSLEARALRQTLARASGPVLLGATAQASR